MKLKKHPPPQWFTEKHRRECSFLQPLFAIKHNPFLDLFLLFPFRMLICSSASWRGIILYLSVSLCWISLCRTPMCTITQVSADAIVGRFSFRWAYAPWLFSWFVLLSLGIHWLSPIVGETHLPGSFVLTSASVWRLRKFNTCSLLNLSVNSSFLAWLSHSMESAQYEKQTG